MTPPFLAWLRGDARPLSSKDLSQTISFARITLVVGLVFLHYDSFPNSTVSPFHGLDVNAHQVATAINSTRPDSSINGNTIRNAVRKL